MSELIKLSDFFVQYAISRTQTYREIHAGRLRLTKLGTASRIARADAEAWKATLPVRTGSMLDA